MAHANYLRNLVKIRGFEKKHLFRHQSEIDKKSSGGYIEGELEIDNSILNRITDTPILVEVTF